MVDRNPLNLHAFAQAGFRCVAGEATEPEILQHARVDVTDEIIVCVPHDEDALELTRVVRHVNPTCRLVVRCRYQGNVPELQKAGADCVVSEEREAVTALKRRCSGTPRGKCVPMGQYPYGDPVNRHAGQHFQDEG